MELSDRLSKLTHDQQLKVIERIFQKLLLAFGNQMQAKWQGIDMNDIYQDWAEALQSCSLGSINHAIQSAKLAEHPPSQGVFLAYCHAYKPPLIENCLPNLHVKDKEKGMRKIDEIKNMLASKFAAGTLTEASQTVGKPKASLESCGSTLDPHCERAA